MPDKEKKTAEILAKAVSILPEGKVEYLLGFAEGALAGAGRTREGQGDDRSTDQSTDRPA